MKMAKIAMLQKCFMIQVEMRKFKQSRFYVNNYDLNLVDIFLKRCHHSECGLPIEPPSTIGRWFQILMDAYDSLTQ